MGSNYTIYDWKTIKSEIESSLQQCSPVVIIILKKFYNQYMSENGCISSLVIRMNPSKK